MKTLLMPVAIVKNGESILLRKMDPAKSPYKQLWALFGGRVEGDESITEALNKELMARWNFTVSIDEKLWWDEEIKIDFDSEDKHFIYLDAICTVESGEPHPVNENETLEWVPITKLKEYDINPPTKVLLQRLGFLD